MARKIKVVDDGEKFGIRITYHNGAAGDASGWVVWEDGKPLLFATGKEAGKALRQLRQMDYSWNCEVSVESYHP